MGGHSCVVLRVLFAHLDIRIELENLDDGLGVLFVILLGDGRRSQKPLPLRRQAYKRASLGVETDMDTVAEVGRIADTAHSRTSLIDFIDPVVNLVIALDFAGNALGSDFASEQGGFGGGILGVGQTNDFKGHLRVFGAGDTGDGVQRDRQNDLASLIFQEI